MSGAVFDLPHHRRLYGQRNDAAHTPAATLSVSVQHTQDAAQTAQRSRRDGSKTLKAADVESLSPGPMEPLLR